RRATHQTPRAARAADAIASEPVHPANAATRHADIRRARHAEFAASVDAASRVANGRYRARDSGPRIPAPGRNTAVPANPDAGRDSATAWPTAGKTFHRSRSRCETSPADCAPTTRHYRPK